MMHFTITTPHIVTFLFGSNTLFRGKVINISLIHELKNFVQGSLLIL